MQKVLKGIAVVSAISLAFVTGTLYIKSIRDDARQQGDFNERMMQLCADARNAGWSKEDKAEFLKRNCQGR